MSLYNLSKAYITNNIYIHPKGEHRIPKSEDIFLMDDSDTTRKTQDYKHTIKKVSVRPIKTNCPNCI